MAESARCVLCPTDFSPFSERALLHAALLARWLGEPVRLLWVQHGSQAPLDGFPPYTTSIRDVPDWRERLLARLESFGEPARRAGVGVEVEVAEGEPVRTILERAAALPASVVALGTHGHGGFEQLFLGSVTEKVLRKAACPVLAVPPGPGPAADGLPVLQTVLCPVDFSDASRRALSWAVTLCRSCEAQLVALHVVGSLPDVDPPSQAHFNVPEFRAILEHDARERLRAVVAAAGIPNRAAEERVVTGKAWRRIVQVARERKAGLIVIGVHGEGGLGEAVFGSTTHHVVRSAPCPVLTAHA